MMIMRDNRCISIVGCGSMGFALAHRLLLSGFTVVMGSRYPDKRKETEFEIVSIDECIRRSTIIFIAIHPEHYIDSLVSHLERDPSLLNEKILVDLSNQTRKKLNLNEPSNADQSVRYGFSSSSTSTGTAIAMLAIVYMPSNLACIFQLAYSFNDNSQTRFIGENGLMTGKGKLASLLGFLT
ncbi:unnamed protein product [Rotaria socialis]|uniref:Pyrroline-5-carboxylate reductase catalytic N-terminal domain-containing protein n=2 Tax=Rotaria socialis TaxID=392032 RepID=A0A820KEL7_9BILA|nr:unnamed protein product [Rotaria socialis]